MALTKKERYAIEALVARMKQPRLGCVEPFGTMVKEQQAPGYEGVSRVYADTWLIAPLENILAKKVR